MKQAYIFLAEGFEEIEGLTVVDLMRRADIDIQMVSIGTSRSVTGRSGIKVEADMLFDDMDTSKGDMFILPGGMPGTKYLGEHEGLEQVLTSAFESGKDLAAICAAPTIFAKYGFTDGKKATSYPGMDDEMKKSIYQTDSVVVDGNVITSRGLGTAISFSAVLIERMKDKNTSQQVLESIVYEDK